MKQLPFIILLIVITISIIVTIHLSRKESFKSLNKSLNDNDLIIPSTINICNHKLNSFMSTDINSDFLVIKNTTEITEITPSDEYPDCDNFQLDIYRYDGQNISLNSELNDNTLKDFGKINNKSITSQLYGLNQIWVEAPLVISPIYNTVITITLDHFRQYGGIYYGPNNKKEEIIPISKDQFKLGKYTLTLYQPYATTREEMDKLNYFMTDNGLIGNIKGFRDKDQKFNIEWIRWRKSNNECISYGTIR